MTWNHDDFDRGGYLCARCGKPCGMQGHHDCRTSMPMVAKIPDSLANGNRPIWAKNKCTCDATEEEIERIVEQVGWYADCEIHVQCDSKCKALVNPVSLDEWKLSALHWKNHSFCYGCSHGC